MDNVKTIAGAIITFLVSASVIDVGQGDAITGLVSAVLVVAAAFGIRSKLAAKPKP